jgi:glutathione S-transferase
MLRLWGRPTSTRTLKVLWALSEIGIEFEFILASATMGPHGSVSKGNRPYGIVDTPAFRAMNPNGTVPAVDDGGFSLWESNTIVRYLAMRYAPDLLYGSDLETFARASQWMDWDSNTLDRGQHILVMQLVRLPTAERDTAAIASAQNELIAAFGIMDAELGRRRFIAGDRFSMGDIPLGIHVHRWHLYDIDRPPMANLARWYAEIRARPAFQRWVENPANHLAG